jgi:hypothetical protein
MEKHHAFILSLLISVCTAAALPLSHTLESMSPEERANAAISVDIDKATPQQAEEARAVAGLWDAGDHGAALGRLKMLEEQVDPDDVELCINWKEPVPSPAPDWGNDVLISAHDSVYSVSLARDPGSGNLFAAISRMNGETNKYVSLHFSNNGGLSWNNPLITSGEGRWPSSVMVMGNYCYLAYGRQNSLRIRRASLTTGNTVNLSNGSAYLDLLTTTTDTVKEVKLAELYENTQLCCGTMHTDGTIRMFWSYDTGGVSWQQFTSPENNAKRGLDMYGNYPYSSYLLFACYINDANVLRLLGLGAGANWDTLLWGSVDTNSYFTSVGAYRDTVLLAFENKYNGDYRIQQAYSSNGGTSWSFGFLTPADTNCFCPDLAMNRGGGMGMTFVQALPQSHRFSWWPYSGGVASKSVISPRAITAAYQPAVEYLGGTAYGVAYISPSSDLNRAYFDRSDWTGVAEKPGSELKVGSLKLLPNAPNPFKQITTIRYQLSRPGKISLKVYNSVGQLVRILVDEPQAAGRHSSQWNGRDEAGREVSSGVYLYRLEAGGEAATGRMAVVK